jgi:hypothetical protein
MGFGDWIEGIGDKAVFSDKGDLMVASDGTQFTVKVTAMGSTNEDRQHAMALAERIIQNL